jgi:polyphosphate kinase
MNERFEKLIGREVEKAKLGEEALIRIKVNNLEDPHMINLLYNASQAGVKVHLIVRGICCLMPGVQGISNNITVLRLVDRYLEHTRLFIFGTGDNPELITGSADWMIRNLHHRIEVCVPIKNIDCKKELIDYFRLQWEDNDKGVLLSPNLEMHPMVADNKEKVNAQHSIYKYLRDKE